MEILNSVDDDIVKPESVHKFKEKLHEIRYGGESCSIQLDKYTHTQYTCLTCETWDCITKKASLGAMVTVIKVVFTDGLGVLYVRNINALEPLHSSTSEKCVSANKTKLNNKANPCHNIYSNLEG